MHAGPLDDYSGLDAYGTLSGLCSSTPCQTGLDCEPTYLHTPHPNHKQTAPPRPNNTQKQSPNSRTTNPSLPALNHITQPNYCK